MLWNRCYKVRCPLAWVRGVAIGGCLSNSPRFLSSGWGSPQDFHRAYLHATQQAFLEANKHPFAHFGGVFHLLRYDNLASAVSKILRGCRREERVRR